MTVEPTCPRCGQEFSPEDTIDHNSGRAVHLDCRLPHRLSGEERALLFQHCWDHAVADCPSCARRFRQHELLSDPFAGGADRCPKCGKDLTDRIRAHLYDCAMLPAEVRRRAQEAREAARKLVKESGQIRDRADVLMREAEVALVALRDAMKQSAFESLRRIIRVKLREGSLPHHGIPPTIPGRPGDDSVCGACGHVIASRDLMMVVAKQGPPVSAPDEAMPIPFHADCFQLWNEERRTVQVEPLITFAPPPSPVPPAPRTEANDRARHDATISTAGADHEEPTTKPSEYAAIPLNLTTDALKRSIELLEGYEGQRFYPEVWRVLTLTLVRRRAGAPEQTIAVAANRLAELPSDVKAALNCP
jgi:hypothetical protein